MLYNYFAEGSKYRTLKILTPVILHVGFKKRGIAINVNELISEFGIKKYEFIYCRKIIALLTPNTSDSEKKELVLILIKRTMDQLSINPMVMIGAKLILEKFWPFMGTGKEEIIAGLTLILTKVMLDMNSCTFNEICTTLCVYFSSVQNSFRYFVLNRFNITTFHGFSRSSALVKEIMEKVVLS